MEDWRQTPPIIEPELNTIPKDLENLDVYV